MRIRWPWICTINGSIWAKTTQWRYTPPTHVVAALDCAIAQYWEEGGLAARGGRYARNCADDRGHGKPRFCDLSAARHSSSDHRDFPCPVDANYKFPAFYDEVKRRGFILYPGKLTEIETFRVGCIGHFGEGGMKAAVAAIRDALDALDIRQIARQPLPPNDAKSGLSSSISTTRSSPEQRCRVAAIPDRGRHRRPRAREAANAEMAARYRSGEVGTLNS